MRVLACILLAGFASGFVPSHRRLARTTTTWTGASRTPRRTTPDGASLRSLTNDDDTMSTYEVDDDEQSEEHLSASSAATANGRSPVVLSAPRTTGDLPRYEQLLEDVGLEGLHHVKSLASHRKVTPSNIFCNRELRMEGIKAIGFDMDYTLAQYKQPAFDQLAFDGAKAKLVEQKGYPPEVVDFEYDHTMWTRGLIIDTQRGNFLKIDRHKYVRVAYHGFDRMSSVTRKLLYSRTFNKVMSFSEKHFVNMDTLFQFVDAHLFALLIDLKDNAEYDVLDFKTYEEIYRDIRECVDLCHRDGVIKDEVAINPDKYLIHDKGMLPMLKRFRDEGVKVFLLTNSQWEYTVTVMNYLFHGRRVDEEEQKKNEWLDLFDLVVVFACKPAYMLDPYLNLFRVETQDGSLCNTDGVYEIEALNPDGATKFLEMGKVFQGGNWMHLQAMLESEAGEEILYVGDHLYSDVLRSKRTLGWRSAFVMPELEDEMRVYAENTDLASSIVSLRKLRDELGLYGEELRRKQVAGDAETDKVLAELDEDDKTIKGKLTELAEQWHYAHHPVWGAMFNAGYQDSRFAFFVANYACLYTSKASNLGLCTSNRSFRTSAEGLPHDKLIESADSNYVEYDVWEDEMMESS